MSADTNRSTWLSPVIGLTFVAISLTGLAMLFHIQVPGMHSLHELAGLSFVVLGGIHLAQHFRGFLSCCSHRKGRIALAIGSAGTLLVLVLGVGHDSRGRHGPPQGVAENH